MLIEVMIEKLKLDFPSLKFTVGESESSIIIPPKNAEVGSVYIEEYLEELLVGIGSFTHWHVGCYNSGLSEVEKANEIATSVSEFLANLFEDKVVFWKNKKNGGFYRLGEKTNSRSWFGKQHKEWVWSGQKHS